MTVTFTYYAHACFSLSDGTTTLLFDPFFTGNPANRTSWEDVSCDYILVSHAHSDHLGDAVAIAKKNDATIISTAEIAGMCADEGCKTHAMNIGGSYRFAFGRVRMTAAVHSSGISGGLAGGFVVALAGQNFYYAGDTALFSDMEWIGRKDEINWAILPIGDNFTMGIEDAAMAVKLLNARHAIPVHYNTWEVISQNPEEFKRLTEKMTRATVSIVEPGNTLKID